jgi:glycine/D-amino acid oxidase-like deaminating enzyme
MGVHYVSGAVVGVGCSRSGGDGQRVIERVDIGPAPGPTPGGGGGAAAVSVGAGTVVNAAGAFANSIVRMCGDDVADLPVRARRRAIFSFLCRGDDALAIPDERTTPLVVDPTGV